MYKIFDTPKNPKDIVNKQYVDGLLSKNTNVIINESIEVLENYWNEDLNGYSFILNHNLNSFNLILSFYNKNNENIFLYYKFLDENNVYIFSSENIYTRIIINYASSTIPTTDVINKSISISSDAWTTESDNEYSYILNHNLNSTDLILNFYNKENENIFIIYYKILDKNNILIISEKRIYIKVIINYISNNAQEVAEEIVNMVKELNNKILELENKVYFLEKSIVKVNKIRIVGPDSIHL